MRIIKKHLGVMALISALLAATCVLSSQAKADAAAGQTTFKAKCAGCHGADGTGKEALKTTDLGAADIQNKADADLSASISSGKGKMPAFKTLTADQVKDLVAFIRSLKK